MENLDVLFAALEVAKSCAWVFALMGVAAAGNAYAKRNKN